MKSKWYESKSLAIAMRKKGYSLRRVHANLGIPKSTLSGWFKNIDLTSKQKQKLDDSWKKGLINARQKAVIWHNQQKQSRIDEARHQAELSLDKLDLSNIAVIELALSLLYLGEGRKNSAYTSLRSSDPLILKFFVSALEKSYKISKNSFKCELHLRADQNSDKLKKYWSKQLSIPLVNFTSVSKDSRTLGSKSYAWYKGVCVVNCGNAAVQRKLLFLSKMFCEKIYKGS